MSSYGAASGMKNYGKIWKIMFVQLSPENVSNENVAKVFAQFEWGSDKHVSRYKKENLLYEKDIEEQQVGWWGKNELWMLI